MKNENSIANLIKLTGLDVQPVQFRIARVHEVYRVGRVSIRDADHFQILRVRRKFQLTTPETVDLHQLRPQGGKSWICLCI